MDHPSQDNRLQIGDHILQINSVTMRGMGSDQVGQILRQSGPQIKLIVARPVDPTSDLQLIQNHLTIVPTRNLNDPTELEKQIQCLQQVRVIATREKKSTTKCTCANNISLIFLFLRHYSPFPIHLPLLNFYPI